MRSFTYRAGLLLVAASACGDLPTEALGTHGASSSSSSSGPDAGTTVVVDDGSTGLPPLEGSTSSASGSSSSSSSGGSSSEGDSSSDGGETGEPLPACGDGQVAVGELCHVLGPSIAVAPAPGRLALGDLDVDGDVDIVLANPLSTMLVVLWGVGDGNFVAPQPLLNAGAVVDDLVLLDVSGDGSPDLVVTDRLGSRVVTYAGNGAGGLFFAGQYPAELAPIRLVAGRVDPDAILDLLALSTSSAAVLRGNGLAGFIPQQQVTLPTGPHAPGLHDLDGDGDLDFLTVNQAGGNTTCFLNMAGTLSPSVIHDTANTPAGQAVGDIDEDGDLDLVVVHASTDDLGVLLGDGLGALGAETLLDVADDPRAVALADLDSDGHLDLAIVHATANLLVLYKGAGNGVFTEGPSFVVSGPTDLYLTELNGDGVPDFVIARAADSAVQVLISSP